MSDVADMVNSAASRTRYSQRMVPPPEPIAEAENTEQPNAARKTRCFTPRFKGFGRATITPFSQVRQRNNECVWQFPAQVVELREGDNAVVDLAGVRKEISLALVEVWLSVTM